MIITDEAVVLRAMKYGDSSIIATLYTKAHGKLPVLAKGARNRSRSRIASLEPMGRVRVVVYTKPNRDLQLLTQCDPLGSMGALTTDLARMEAGMTVVELAHLATVPGEVHPEVFDLIVDTIKALQRATPRPGNSLYFFEVRLLELLGFRPELGKCSMCGVIVEGSEHRNGPEGFDVAPSGIVCASCSGRSGVTMRVSVPALRTLAHFQISARADAVHGVVLTSGVEHEIQTLLRSLVQHHITGMRPLRSEKVFSSLH